MSNLHAVSLNGHPRCKSSIERKNSGNLRLSLFRIRCLDSPLPSILPVFHFFLHRLVFNPSSSSGSTLSTAFSVAALTFRWLRFGVFLQLHSRHRTQENVPPISPPISYLTWVISGFLLLALLVYISLLGSTATMSAYSHQRFYPMAATPPPLCLNWLKVLPLSPESPSTLFPRRAASPWCAFYEEASCSCYLSRRLPLAALHSCLCPFSDDGD